MKFSTLDPLATSATPRPDTGSASVNPASGRRVATAATAPILDTPKTPLAAESAVSRRVATVATPSTFENSNPQIAVELIRLAGRLLQDSPLAPPDPAVKESPIAPDAIN